MLPMCIKLIMSFATMLNENEYLRLLGLNIRELREEKGLSQQELADNCEIAKSTVQRIEKGQMNPTITKLKRICESLGIDIKELII